MNKKGIDVSHWNGDIDFNKVKSAGYEFVIIKAGGSDKGFYKDTKFERNYKEAKAAGLLVGAYYFVGKQFLGEISGIADAKRFENLISGKQFEMPVYLDIETTPAQKKELATIASIAFCEYLESKGFYAGIYGSDLFVFKDKLDVSKLKAFTLWVARYGGEPSYIKDAHMWQYSSKGAVPGISGSVDLDSCYVDFTKAIKSKGLNGFTKAKKRKDD